MQTSKKENLKKYIILLGIFIIFVIFGFFYSRQGQPGISSPKTWSDLPIFGWVVDEDLGIGQVPFGPIAQRFILEHWDGWELFAYCVDAKMPSPPVGTICEMIKEDTFWCGDEYQPVKIYEIPETPRTATVTETMTATSTSTSTVTMTATSTNTKMSTSTMTATLTPTFTSTSTITRTTTETSTITETMSPNLTSTEKIDSLNLPSSTTTESSTNNQNVELTHTPTKTPTMKSRIKMGGIGNVQKNDVIFFVLGMALFIISSLLALFGLGKWLQKKTK